MLPKSPAPAGSASSSHEWAEHLIWMEGGEPMASPRRQSAWPGVVAVLAVAAAAFALAARLGLPGGLGDPVLASMLAGVVAGNLLRWGRLLPGVSWAARWLLPAGIVLLGARMDFSEALRVGLPGLGLSVVAVGLSMALMSVIGPRLGLGSRMSCLLGVGTGICGGTAIVAVAPLLRAREGEVLMGVGLVTLVGLVAMLALPPLAAAAGLSSMQLGMLAGLTIQQTPQAIAAGFAHSEEAGQIATVAKLSRVCLLAPVAAAIAWAVASQNASARARRSPMAWLHLLPKFALGFLLLAAAKSTGLLPEIRVAWESLPGVGGTAATIDTAGAFKWASGFLLSVGMAAVGYQTRLSGLRELGWRPALALVATALAVAFVAAVPVLFLFD